MRGVSQEARDLIAKRRKSVSERYLAGIQQYKIAQEVGVDPAQISRDLAALRKEWMASSLANIDAKKAEELARLDRLEEVAWAAWDRSCQPAEVRTAKHVTDADGSRDEATKREEGQYGDPRFLAEIRQIVRLRLEVIGVIGKAGAEGTTVNVNVTTHERIRADYEQLRKLPPEELMRLHRQAIGLPSDN